MTLSALSIVVENTVGSSPERCLDVTIADTLEPCHQIPTNVTGLNLQVTDGAGTSLAYVGDLFSSGITLIDQRAHQLQAITQHPTKQRHIRRVVHHQITERVLETGKLLLPQRVVHLLVQLLQRNNRHKNIWGDIQRNGENASIRLFANPLSDGRAFSADVAVNDFNNGTKDLVFTQLVIPVTFLHHLC